NFSTNLYFIPAYSPELNRIEMVWKQMKYYWRDFQVMAADKIERWVEKVSNLFGKEYMFTF
ncbi:transposase, partial [Acinetobacter sp. YH01020]|uniref:transposase n=1 Tax=Acinetobacter sp. YH01020 TaxID=2601034 RepID=UPI0015D44161